MDGQFDYEQAEFALRHGHRHPVGAVLCAVMANQILPGAHPIFPKEG